MRCFGVCLLIFFITFSRPLIRGGYKALGVFDIRHLSQLVALVGGKVHAIGCQWIPDANVKNFFVFYKKT
jgi:hypothetical protein